MTISIVTATFNSGKTLVDTFQSILHQTYSDIEYIIIDGNSTDNTLDIIKSFEPLFEGRMRWVSEPDGGIYDAMNKGIKMAIGDLVGTLNSDDYFSSNNVLEKIVKEFEKNKDIECTFSDICFVSAKNSSKVLRRYSAKNWNPNMFRWGFMPPHPTFYTYKHNYERYGYYQIDYQIASDYELLIRFLKTNGLKYHYIPINMVTMRMGGASTRSIKSNWVLNKEIVRGCAENKIYTNMPILFFKYFKKVFELIKT